MQPFVTAIVTVYNKSEWIDRCVQSIVDQSEKNIEILLIDDGSKDDSLEKCKAWEQKDSRIRVISQSNQGLGPARNTGLDVANGEFVSFIDADDFIDVDTFKICKGYHSNIQGDVYYYGRYAMGEESKGIDPNYLKIDEVEIYESDEERKSVISKILGSMPGERSRNYIGTSACCSIYSNDIIQKNKVRFVNVLSEDIVFNAEFNKYSSKIVAIPHNLYYNVIHDTSLSRGYNENRFNLYKKCYDELMKQAEYYRDRDIPDAEQRVANRFMLYVIKCIDAEATQIDNDGFISVYRKIKKICKDDYVKVNYNISSVKDYNLKRKIRMLFIVYKYALVVTLQSVLKYAWRKRVN